MSKEKEPIKEGFWKFADAYEMFGGDEACWDAHGNPVVSIFCSECGFEPYVGDVVAIPDEAAEQICNYKYCPNCGVKNFFVGKINPYFLKLLII